MVILCEESDNDNVMLHETEEFSKTSTFHI
jgi:hypothetical protein